MEKEGVVVPVKKKKLDAILPQKTDEFCPEATFPYNFYNKPREEEDRPREFSEFDPQTW